MVSFCPIFQLLVLSLQLLNVPPATTHSKCRSEQLAWRWRGKLVRGEAQRTSPAIFFAFQKHYYITGRTAVERSGICCAVCHACRLMQRLCSGTEHHSAVDGVLLSTVKCFWQKCLAIPTSAEEWLEHAEIRCVQC